MMTTTELKRRLEALFAIIKQDQGYTTLTVRLEAVQALEKTCSAILDQDPLEKSMPIALKAILDAFNDMDTKSWVSSTLTAWRGHKNSRFFNHCKSFIEQLYTALGNEAIYHFYEVFALLNENQQPLYWEICNFLLQPKMAPEMLRFEILQTIGNNQVNIVGQESDGKHHTIYFGLKTNNPQLNLIEVSDPGNNDDRYKVAESIPLVGSADTFSSQTLFLDFVFATLATALEKNRIPITSFTVTSNFHALTKHTTAQLMRAIISNVTLTAIDAPGIKMDKQLVRELNRRNKTDYPAAADKKQFMSSWMREHVSMVAVYFQDSNKVAAGF